MAGSNRAVHWTAAAVVGSLLADVDQATSSAAAHVPSPEATDGVLAIVTVIAALLLARRAARVAAPARACTTALLGAAILALGGGRLLFAAVPTPWGPAAARVVLIANLTAVAVCLGTSWRALLRPSLSLGAVAYLSSPVRLILATLPAAGWLVASAGLSPVQRAALAAALLALCAFGAQSPLAFLHGCRAPLSRRRLLTAFSVTVGVAMLLLASRSLTPSGEVSAYPDTVLYAGGDSPRYVVTGGPAGFDLFVDRQLVASSLEGGLYADALVAPALALCRSPRRVLILGPTTGLTAAAALRDARVAEVVVVTPDERGVALARRLPWLHAASSDALGDPRVQVVIDEPVPWLAERREGFDVVVIDTGAPADYRAGKIFTTLALARLLGVLADDGVAVVPAASALESPDAHASIVASVRAAGLHPRVQHVGLVTLGEWSIVLATRAPRPLPRDLRVDSPFMTTETLLGGLTATPDRSVPDGAPSTLHEPLAVSAFRMGRAGR